MRNIINPNSQNIADDVHSYFNSPKVTYITNASARIKQTLEVIETEKSMLILNNPTLFSTTGGNYFPKQSPNIYPVVLSAFCETFTNAIKDISSVNNVTESTIKNKFTREMGIDINKFNFYAIQACVYGNVAVLQNLLQNNCTEKNVNDGNAVNEYFNNIF